MSPSIVAGGSQVFTVGAFDQYGNSLGDVTSSAGLTALVLLLLGTRCIRLWLVPIRLLQPTTASLIRLL